MNVKLWLDRLKNYLIDCEMARSRWTTVGLSFFGDDVLARLFDFGNVLLLRAAFQRRKQELTENVTEFPDGLQRLAHKLSMLSNFPDSMKNQPESLLAFKWCILMRKRMNWQQLRHQSLALRRIAYVGSRGLVAEACKISSAKAGIAPVNAHHVGKIEDPEMLAPRTRERSEGKSKERKSSKLPIRILMAATLQPTLVIR
ncbi:hypothetical protein D917_00042 [Trichinella nativa]|uniref:Uncharacterized protein n=1 Tax=Trichinella nativa TaxID=6335 RepID=A0A1Y3E6E4_9BILA|nr:hypothetical protein D917_00042 [Trichinella nativa]